MAVSEKKYHVGLGPGDVGDYVLVPGDPFRTPLVARHLEGAREVAFSREYRTFTGKVDGVPVSTMSTGMGGPSVAIGVEELHELGVHTLLRVGTCGASQPEIRMGDLVISYAAVRSEGTPNGYIPLEYPAVASLHVVVALVEAAGGISRACAQRDHDAALRGDRGSARAARQSPDATCRGGRDRDRVRGGGDTGTSRGPWLAGARARAAAAGERRLHRPRAR